MCVCVCVCGGLRLCGDQREANVGAHSESAAHTEGHTPRNTHTHTHRHTQGCTRHAMCHPTYLCAFMSLCAFVCVSVRAYVCFCVAKDALRQADPITKDTKQKHGQWKPGNFWTHTNTNAATCYVCVVRRSAHHCVSGRISDAELT